jgi:type IV pilus assembly protein PilE
MRLNATKGFTILELLVTIVIIGILVSFAIPRYQAYIQRSNATEAIEALQLIMEAEERYYGDRSSYTVDLTDLGFSSGTFETAQGLYDVTAGLCPSAASSTPSPATQCILLTATPKGSQEGTTALTLNSRGDQTGF